MKKIAVRLTFGISCGYILSLGGNFGGFSLRLDANFCVCNINCSRVGPEWPRKIQHAKSK